MHCKGKFIFATIIKRKEAIFCKISKHLANAINTHYNNGILQEWMVCIVRVNYKKLWVMCAEREMSKADLRKQAGLSSATFTKLRKNQEVNLSVLLKIADVMDCNAGDMMDFVKEEQCEPEGS